MYYLMISLRIQNSPCKFPEDRVCKNLTPFRYCNFQESNKNTIAWSHRCIDPQDKAGTGPPYRRYLLCKLNKREKRQGYLQYIMIFIC